MGEGKQKKASGSYADILKKSRKLNPEAYRRKAIIEERERWLDEMEEKDDVIEEPDFGA